MPLYLGSTYSLLSTVSTNRGPCVAASAVSEPQALSVGDGGRTVPDSPPRFAPLNHLAFHRRIFKHCRCQCAHDERLPDSKTLVRVVSVFRTLSVLEPVCPPVRGLRPVRLHHWPATTSSARKCNAEDLPTLCCR